MSVNEIPGNAVQCRADPNVTLTPEGEFFLTATGQRLKPFNTKRGALVSVQTRTPAGVHRVNRACHLLLASTFLEPPVQGSRIRFKDKNKLNYHLNNIEWVRPKTRPVSKNNPPVLTNDTIQQVFREHYDFYVRITKKMGLLHEDAEDVVQSTFMLCCMFKHRYDGTKCGPVTFLKMMWRMALRDHRDLKVKRSRLETAFSDLPTSTLYDEDSTEIDLPETLLAPSVEDILLDEQEYEEILQEHGEKPALMFVLLRSGYTVTDIALATGQVEADIRTTLQKLEIT